MKDSLDRTDIESIKTSLRNIAAFTELIFHRLQYGEKLSEEQVSALLQITAERLRGNLLDAILGPEKQ